MNNAWIPLFPVLFPLIGGGLALFPWERYQRFPLRRWLYRVLLVGTGISLGLASGQSVRSPSAIPFLDVALELRWTPLGIWIAYLLVGALVLGEAPQWHQPLAALDETGRLGLLATTMAVLSAGDFIGLGIAWGAQALVLLLLWRLWGEKAPGRFSAGLVWSSFASTACLMLGSLDVAARTGSFALSALSSEVAPLGIWAAAVGLRFFPWSRRGGLRRYWEVYLTSLFCGFYLWLRLGPFLRAEPWWIPGATVAVWCFLGVIMLFQRTPQRAFPYLVSHWLLLALAAPFVSPQGVLVSLLVFLHLAMSLVVLRMWTVMEGGISPSGRVAWLVAWGSLGGIPFTLGFVAHWLLGALAWQAGQRALVIWLLLGYFFTAWPVRRYWRALGEHIAGPVPSDRRGYLVGSAMGALGVGLVVLGVYPQLLVWAGGPFDVALSAFSWKAEDAFPIGIRLALVIIPFLPAFVPGEATWRHVLWSGVYRLGRTVSARVSYLSPGRIGSALLNLGRQGLGALVETFPFGWVVLWGIALLYLLAGI